MNPIRWGTLSEAEKDKWTKYRQELLDIPQQEGFPFKVVWPRLWDDEMVYICEETHEKLFY